MPETRRRGGATLRAFPEIEGSVAMGRSVMALMAAGLALAAGCAGLGRFEADMNRYVGRPEAELRRGLGPPQRSWPLADGTHVLQFVRARAVQYSGRLRSLDDKPSIDPTAGLPSGTYDPSGSAFRAASAPAPIDEASVCAVNFTVDAAGIVKSWSAQQGDCRAY